MIRKSLCLKNQKKEFNQNHGLFLVSVIKKSIDARKKNNICLVYAVVVQLKDNKKIIKLIGKDKDISLVELEQKEC